MTREFDLNAKLQRMAHIRRTKPAYQEVMDFYERIYRERDSCSSALVLPEMRIETRILNAKLQGGFPLLDKAAVTLDLVTLSDFFIHLLQVSREKNPDAVTDIGAFFQRTGLEVSTVIGKVWEGDFEFMLEEPRELADPFLLYFLLVECLKPVYTFYARQLEEHLWSKDWDHGYCPICGELPAMSEIAVKASQRNLFCVYCETTWPFDPGRCPFCGKEDEDGRSYLWVGNEREYRIEVCSECGRYLKVVDTDILGERVPLDVENIATLHIDIMAQQHGYERGAPIQLLI
ncbi:MAG TPA: formate dehydrogenase accessory protein FdhE [Thermodesulfobacteriota bacterium]|nr:formate dehydrogenase accessory protein FdhE [Deltaproteobacteria bacterium]HNR12101.1 formate dehydrogenase accessory protein FdhE [Thermodesulfobacteriota bacterium]HNU72458.1 formate dehydrogenase accessory protein FdhE [Thermodesulfobacteriota bacterium]